VPIQIRIPRQEALRRLAGALALNRDSSTTRLRGSVMSYFRSFPWSGVAVQTGPLPEMRLATMSQYFAVFDWEGTRPAMVAQSEPANDMKDEHRPSLQQEEQDKVAAFFDSFLD